MSIDSLKVLYTNADQFLNTVHDLQTFIAGDEPDLILISELLPKNCSVFINISNFMIPGYSLYLNFDSTADTSTTLGIRGVGIFVCKRFRLYKSFLKILTLKITSGLVLICRVMINY